MVMSIQLESVHAMTKENDVLTVFALTIIASMA